jgi:hypothetical protein
VQSVLDYIILHLSAIRIMVLVLADRHAIEARQSVVTMVEAVETISKSRQQPNPTNSQRIAMKRWQAWSSAVCERQEQLPVLSK